MICTACHSPAIEAITCTTRAILAARIGVDLGQQRGAGGEFRRAERIGIGIEPRVGGARRLGGDAGMAGRHRRHAVRGAPQRRLGQFAGMGIAGGLAGHRAQAEAQRGVEPGAADPAVVQADLLALAIFQVQLAVVAVAPAPRPASPRPRRGRARRRRARRTAGRWRRAAVMATFPHLSQGQLESAWRVCANLATDHWRSPARPASGSRPTSPRPARCAATARRHVRRPAHATCRARGRRPGSAAPACRRAG